MNKSEEIAAFIRNGIREGAYPMGSKIPSEKAFCEQFGVSRMTVNKAIQSLVQQQILSTRRGYGTTVLNTMEKEINKLTSFSEDIRLLGLEPRAKVIAFECVSRGYETQKEKLLLPHDSLIYFLKRIRYGNDIPIAMDVAYINAKIVPTLDVSRIEGSLYEYLEGQLHLEISSMKYEFTAEKAGKELSELLEISKDDAVLRQNHITYTASGEIFEYVETFYNPKMYHFSGVSYR